jgi:hypothetical protein
MEDGKKARRKRKKGGGMKRVKVGSGGIEPRLDPDTALTQPITDKV